MEKVLTDDTLTQEQAKIVARRAGNTMKATVRQAPKAMDGAARAGKEMLDPTLDQASGIANQAFEQATAMVRNVSSGSDRPSGSRSHWRSAAQAADID